MELRTAAGFGDYIRVRTLLSSGNGRQEILESRDSSTGRTALHMAAEAGQKRVIEVLLDYGEWFSLRTRICCKLCQLT